MSSVRITNSITGELDDTAYSLSGNCSHNINGCTNETLSVDTSYTNAQAPSQGQVVRALIVNDGDQEVVLRVLRVSATTWDYFRIPAGRFHQLMDNGTEVYDTQIKQISVKAVSGTSRVIILQAWR